MDRLHALHWEETGTGKVFTQRKFNWTAYERMQAAGILHVIVAREGGVMAGYCLSLVMPHLHSDEMSAMVDNVFMAAEYRKGRNGLDLLKAAERFWQVAGVKVAFVSFKREPDRGALLERTGWEWHEKLFFKRLEAE